MKDIYSQPRLETYSNFLYLSDQEAIYAHHWNTKLSASLFPILQTFELTLRNSINKAVIQSDLSHYQNDVWWFQHLTTNIQDAKIRRMNPAKKAEWLRANGQRKRYSYFEQNIHRAKRELSNQNRNVTPDSVLSRQTFSFWTKMLTDDFSDPGTKLKLWPNLLPEVFPNSDIPLSYQLLQEKASGIKDLRNRISHHEPVWKFFHKDANGELDYNSPIYGIKPSLLRLKEQYLDILLYIKWMSIPAYNEIINIGLHLDFEYLCSEEGFGHYINIHKKSKIQSRLQNNKVK